MTDDESAESRAAGAGSFVTGASGFIGTHLVRALAAQAAPLDVCVRRAERLPSDQPAHVRVHVNPDVSDAAHAVGHCVPDSALSGRVCYHLAGLAHAGAVDADARDARAALFAVNSEATVAWFARALEAGAARFVWVSSARVLGAHSDAPLAPSAPRRPLDGYSASKAAAEEALLDFAVRQGVAAQLVIVRPPLVYGPGVAANYRRLLQLGLSGWPLPLKRACALRSWVSVGNLVDLLCAPTVRGERVAEVRHDNIWHVSDAEDLSVAQMLASIAAAGDRPLRLWPLPQSVARVLGKLTGQSGTVQRLFAPLQLDMSDTRAALGWQPPQSGTDAVRETVQWYTSSR